MRGAEDTAERNKPSRRWFSQSGFTFPGVCLLLLVGEVGHWIGGVEPAGVPG
jgi:hypothetical protein